MSLKLFGYWKLKWVNPVGLIMMLVMPLYGVVSVLKCGAWDLESFKIRKQEFILGHEDHGNELLGKMAGPCQEVVEETLMRELSRCKMKSVVPDISFGLVKMEHPGTDQA